MNPLEKLQKKFKNKTQIGGKGTFRRKTKKLRLCRIRKSKLH